KDFGMKLIIYGKGDFAKLVYHYVCNYTKYEVIVFCVDVDFIDGNKYLGVPLLRVDEISSVYDKHEVKLFLAVGYSLMFLREEMFRKAQKTGFEFINIVCENVMIDMSASVGVNNIFMPNVVVEPFVALGDNNVLW